MKYPLLLALGLLVSLAPGLTNLGRSGGRKGVNTVYVPTPIKVVDKMLRMAKVTKNDVVYDLGCGDGRIVAYAAKKYGARGVGIDINPVRIKEAKETVKKYKVEKLVEIRQGNALKVKDLEKATVVALYMLPEFMQLLEPIAKKTLKPGTRIVAHDFPFPNWKPDQVVTYPGPEREHILYLWTVRAEKNGKGKPKE